jgi:hypothetical protein
VDPATISRAAKIDMLTALERHKCAAEAGQVRVLAALAAEEAPADELDRQVDKEWVREDVACALRVSAVTAAERLRLATDLTRRLPGTVAALAGGRLSAAMSRHLAESVTALPESIAREVEKRSLQHASTQTFSQFARTVRRAVLQADPEGQERRHAAAVDERRVTHRAVEDGMGELWAVLPAHEAAESYARLDRLAHQQCPDGDDERTMDQRRADILVALLTGRPVADGESGPAAAPPSGPAVQVTVALSTLLGVDSQPGELAGHGPIPAALARAIAFDPTGTWRRLVTDPHGQLLDYGRTRYRPPAALADHVRARDVTCRFPVCNRRARRCELDHIVPRIDDGTTSDVNLHPLCSRDHHLRHEAGWHPHRHPDGTTEWISPTGHRYVKPPEQLPIDRTGTPDDPDP